MKKKLLNPQVLRLALILCCLFGIATNTQAANAGTPGFTNSLFSVPNKADANEATVSDRAAITYLANVWSEQAATSKAATNGFASSPFRTVVQEYKVTDSPVSCDGAFHNGVIFRNLTGCQGPSYQTWHAGADLRFIEYSDGTATMTGSLHDNGQTATVSMNFWEKSGSGDSWPSQCYQNSISNRYYYRNFSGTFRLNGQNYSIARKSPAKHVVMGNNAGNSGDGRKGFGAWTNGSIGQCTEMFGVFTPVQRCTVNAGPDKTICAGDSVTLTATGTGNFRWSTGETTRTITVSPTTRTRYSVTSTLGSCSKTDYVYVNVLNVTAEAGPDQTICGGTSTTLTATGGGTYLWSTGETTATITVSPNQNTTYTVTVSNGSCQDSDSVTVNVAEQVHADAGPDKLICDDKDSTTLTASGGGTYLWSTGETTATITVSPTQTTTYTVVVTKGDCQDTDMVTVTVSSLQVDLGNDVSLCSDASKTLTATIVSNTITAPCTDQVTFEWKKDDQVIAGATGQTLNVTMPGVYSVTARNCNGCTATDLVVVNPKLEVDLGSDAVICADEEVTLTPEITGYTGCDTGENVSYLWSTGATTPTITVSTSGTYSVTVTSCDNQCSVTDEVMVTVKPEINANAGSDVVICYGENTVLTATGGGTYLWSTGETTPTITVNPTETTTYSVTVTANGCTATDEVVVTVKPRIEANAGADVTVCYNAETVLTATGGGTYLWSTGETTPTITVNLMETTTFTVAVTVDGCTVTDEVVVTVRPQIEVMASADVTICEAEDTVLTATGDEGTYLWSTGETTPSITVNPSVTTTYTVSLTKDGCTVSDSVVVNVDRKVTIGDYVWTDENRNGVQDANETGVNGVTATLYHCDGTQVATTTTANNAAGEAGAYNFRVCPDSGFYYVVFSDIPDGLEFTQRNMGLDDAVDSDANQNGQTQCFEVEREDIPTIDAGLVEICQISVDAGNDIRICPGETIMITADVEDETAECPGGCQYPITTRDRCFGPTGDFEIYLVSTGDMENFKFKASTQSFQKLSNGSARYTATASNGTDVITIDALLTGNTTIAPVGSPNANSCQDFDTSNWEYWTTWSGTINSQNHGVFNLSIKGSAFQLGVGADVVRTGLGASGWFYVTGGDGFYTNGDVNIPLEECVEQNVSYVWSTVDGEIVGNPNQKTISINKPGTYVVTVENCIDCEATDTIIVTRKFCYTESKGERPSRIKNVYPIPVKSNGVITLELHREEAPESDDSLTAISLKGSADFVDRKEDVQVALYDITGRMIGVPKSFVMENGNVTIHFSLDNIQAGSYILRTQAGTWSDSKNIIVE